MNHASSLSKTEKGLFSSSLHRNVSPAASFSHVSVAAAGVEHLSDVIPPHESYEGLHRYDPNSTWTPEEESALVRKTDLYLLSWVCVMVSCTLNLNDPSR